MEIEHSIRQYHIKEQITESDRPNLQKLLRATKALQDQADDLYKLCEKHSVAEQEVNAILSTPKKESVSETRKSQQLEKIKKGIENFLKPPEQPSLSDK